MKKILVVVDMQNDFIDGALGSPMAEAIVDNVKNKIREYSDNQDVIIFTKDTHDTDYLEYEEGKHLSVKHCINGTYGWLIKEGLIDNVDLYLKKNVYIVTKPTFGAKNLINILVDRALIISNGESYYGDGITVELVGLCTDICVISNAVIAKTALPNAHIVVDAACCAGVTPKSHDTAIEAMQAFMVEVVNHGKEPWREVAE